MPYYSDTLESLRNQILLRKPNVSAELATEALNRKMRLVLNMRPYWTGLLSRKILYLPAEYTTGTVSVTKDSSTVTGSATNWPVNDLVNTTTGDISRPGIHRVTPASMENIEKGTVLYVDSAGSNPETVAVVETTANNFIAKFDYAHSGTVTLEASSLAGRQFRLDESAPVYTILAVKSATELILDAPWKESSRSGSAYHIRGILHYISPNIRDIVAAVDRFQGYPLGIQREQGYLDHIDYQRRSTGAPRLLTVAEPHPLTRLMRYEVWPSPVNERQIEVLIVDNWADMKNKGDRPPPFMDASVLVAGALAEIMITKVPDRASGGNDPFYDPIAAREYKQEFLAGLQGLIEADEARFMKTLQQEWTGVFLAEGDTPWHKAHDIDMLLGRY